TCVVRFVAVFILVAGILAPIDALAQSSNALRKLDRSLKLAVESASPAAQSVIVRAVPGQLDSLRTWLAGRGAAIQGKHPSINAVSAIVTPGDLIALNDSPLSLSVSSNAPVQGSAAPGGSQPPAVSVLRSTLGLASNSPTGRGIGVAIIDSGIQPSQDFDGRIVAFYDYVKAGGGYAAAYDDFGHGTHVAGLIGGSGRPPSPFPGAAPNLPLTPFHAFNHP